MTRFQNSALVLGESNDPFIASWTPQQMLTVSFTVELHHSTGDAAANAIA